MAKAMGTLLPGAALAVGVHLEACADCRSAMRYLDQIAAALSAALDKAPVRPEIAARARAALSTSPAPSGPSLAEGLTTGPWTPFAPGLELAAVEGVFGSGESVSLLRGAPGAVVPMHGHTGLERFAVLEGSFVIDDTVYRAGDYMEVDQSVVHSPRVPEESSCLCLVVLQGGVRFIDPPAPTP